MTHTVHLDRQGYVTEVYKNTRRAQLDERKFSGTLMEVTGNVFPGLRWDGQRFVTPPPRVAPEAVRAERDRRVDGPFPERFRAQITALGGDNALKVSTYVADVMRVAESFADDPPRDYKDDHHWPKVPKLRDVQVPVRVHDGVPSVSGPPVTVNVAPVINTTQAEPKALVVHHEQPSLAPEPLQREQNLARATLHDEYGLSPSDPLYALKRALVRTIEETVERHGNSIPAEIRDAWADQLAEMAAIATASTSEDQIAAQGERVAAFIEGKAA